MKEDGKIFLVYTMDKVYLNVKLYSNKYLFK